MNNNLIPKYQFYISKLTDEGAWIAEETPVFANSEKELKQLYQMTGNTITINRYSLNPAYVNMTEKHKTVKNTPAPALLEPDNIDNTLDSVEGDISKMKFKIGEGFDDSPTIDRSPMHSPIITYTHEPQLTEEKFYTVDGTNFKISTDGILYIEKWVDVSEDDPRIRVVYDNKSGANRIVSLKGKHMEILKWVKVENE